MEIGLGFLGWPPEVFWAATTPELTAALEGLAERHGGRAHRPLTRAELAELMDQYPD